ncbi:MAG: SDR family NAD(P)-dependent oxidoreductase, partial [Rhizobiales bacterium]|nr:SDR family NAD(P)-dependent oxidoreductase [Hyphomicrobiales bacterium]
MQLDGKVAIVTGAASGLGRASCIALAKAGARIAAFDRDEARLADVCRELGGDVLSRVVDVANEESVSTAVDAVVAAFGAVHIGVNCAGVADASKTVSSKGQPFPLATWSKVIGINLTGTFN